jgi:hypothetical protein
MLFTPREYLGALTEFWPVTAQERDNTPQCHSAPGVQLESVFNAHGVRPCGDGTLLAALLLLLQSKTEEMLFNPVSNSSCELLSFCHN